MLSTAEKSIIIEECRQEVMKLVSEPGNYRLTTEVILNDGTRRLYRAKSKNKKKAVIETLTFVEAIERTTGEQVVWRFKGENTYHMGTLNCGEPKSLLKRIVDYFFGE